jgi:hypothetical protein
MIEYAERRKLKSCSRQCCALAGDVGRRDGCDDTEVYDGFLRLPLLVNKSTILCHHPQLYSWNVASRGG